MQVEGYIFRLVALSLLGDYLAIERGLAQLQILLHVLEYSEKLKEIDSMILGDVTLTLTNSDPSYLYPPVLLFQLGSGLSQPQRELLSLQQAVVLAEQLQVLECGLGG